MPAERNPKFSFAPRGYRSEWQHAPRNSGIPHGYFNADRTDRIVFWAVMACLAVALFFGA